LHQTSSGDAFVKSRRRVNSAVGPHKLWTRIMSELNANVAIVVDPNFGDRLPTLANQMSIWIADTPTNRSAAESLRSQAGSNITTFRVAGTDAAEWCRAILPQVELHHGEHSQSPPCDSIEVFGAGANADLRDAFSNYGFTISSERSDGFRAVR
jgi:hypothetical protein